MKKDALFFYKCVVQEPRFPRPKEAIFCDYSRGFAGFKKPQNRTLEFYGTIPEFETHLKTRKRPRVDRSDRFTIGGRPTNVR